MSQNAPYLLDPAGRRFPLTGAVTVLGRAPACAIHIPDPRASRRHAEVRWDGETGTLHDLGSANGTFLNGQRVVGSQPLQDGDEIGIAGAVFTFRDPEATVRVGDLPALLVDKESGAVWMNRRPVSLSPKEQALFNLLYYSAGRVCSKQEIAEAVWPEYRAEVFDYQIESLVKRLRERLEPDPRRPVLLLTVRGQGYRLITGR